MNPFELESPITDSGIRSVNFFNGRLLTANDLRREQEARRAMDWRLGEAIGDGVAYGLEASKHAESTVQNPLVTVKAGLAVNRAGRALKLEQDATIALVRKSRLTATADTTFAQCGNLVSGTYVAGAGVYLLTIAPATQVEGKAQTNGLDLYGGRCNVDSVIEGVQFRLLQIDEDDLGFSASGTTLADVHKFRNKLAYACFGEAARHNWGVRRLDPEAAAANLLDELRPAPLSLCDVPLALIYWTLSGGLQFIELWSVRRQINASGPASLHRILGDTESWLAPEARLLQFIAQAEELASRRPQQPAAVSRDMSQFFEWIPPAGLVPIATSAASQGLSESVFFGGRALGTPTTISAAEALSVLSHSLAYPPMKVEANTPVQLYWVRENLDAVQAGKFNQLYLLYTSRALHGFMEKDLVVDTLEQTWRSYGDLIRKGIVLPSPLTTNALPVWTALYGVQQTIMHFAVSRESLARARVLNQTSVREVMRDLHGLEKRFTEALRVTFSGDTQLGQRTELATRVDRLLDVALSGGDPGLLPAITTGTLHEVMRAQREINALVSAFAGEVPFGHVQIAHIGSPRGTKLVPGDPAPFTFIVEVINRTDKRTEMTLQAQIANAPTGSWGGSIMLRNLDSPPKTVSPITLNPDERTTVQVEILTPSDAVAGEDVTLRFSASLGPPADRSWQEDIALTTDSASGPPQEWTLSHTVVSQASGRTNAQTNTTYAFVVDTEFLASRAPTSTVATIIVTPQFTGGATGWTINVVGDGTATSTPAGAVEYSVTLPRPALSGRERTTIEITTPPSRPTTSNRICAFTVSASASVIDPTSGATVHVTSTPTEMLSVTLKP